MKTTSEALRRHADIVAKQDDPDTATALRWAADDISELRGTIISACHHLDAGRLDEAWKTLTSIIEAKPL